MTKKRITQRREAGFKETLSESSKLLSQGMARLRKRRLKEMHFAYEHQHDPVYGWVAASDDTPSNDRLVNCQVWTNLPGGGMLKEFGVPLRYRCVDNIATWWTKDNRSFNGWVTYWRDFE